MDNIRHLLLSITLLLSATAFAQAGSEADSLYNLANRHFNLRQYKEAAKCYRQAADEGHIEAAWKATQCYIRECGVSYNHSKACHYAEIAANAGITEAMTFMGTAAYQDKKYSTAIYWYEKAADKGDDIAMQNLGNLCALGEGVKKNIEGALLWWEKAAEKGNVGCQAVLGECYMFGKGVAQDYEKGVRWLRMAADNDDAQSAFYLANYMESLPADSIDYVSVAYYYMVAANQGNSDAQCSLGTLYWEGKGVEQSDRKAYDWFQESANHANPLGLYNAAYCLYLGRGVAKDKEKARQYFKTAAQLGNEQAKEVLKQIK